VPLFIELQAYNFGVVSITRPYKEFLDESSNSSIGRTLSSLVE
jgi:hypothetical protein